jgi:hypothetical protein
MDKELLIKEFQSALSDDKWHKEVDEKYRADWAKERNSKLSEDELKTLIEWQKDVGNQIKESFKDFDPEKANMKLDSWRKGSMDVANKKLEEREFTLEDNSKFKSSKLNVVLEKLKII